MSESKNSGTRQMQLALIEEMRKTGTICHLQSRFLCETSSFAGKSDFVRLKPTNYTSDNLAFSIADEIVMNYIRKYPQLGYTLKTIINEKQNCGMNFSKNSNPSKLSLKRKDNHIRALIEWNADTIALRKEMEEKRRIEEEKRALNLKKAKEEELARQNSKPQPQEGRPQNPGVPKRGRGGASRGGRGAARPPAQGQRPPAPKPK